MAYSGDHGGQNDRFEALHIYHGVSGILRTQDGTDLAGVRGGSSGIGAEGSCRYDRDVPVSRIRRDEDGLINCWSRRW